MVAMAETFSATLYVALDSDFNLDAAAVVRIRYDTPEKFLAESEGRYAIESRLDAFGWFEMDIQCCACSHTTKPWVSYETA
jgi:hypothetical protein